jgi:hypothetical protein
LGHFFNHGNVFVHEALEAIVRTVVKSRFVTVTPYRNNDNNNDRDSNNGGKESELSPSIPEVLFEARLFLTFLFNVAFYSHVVFELDVLGHSVVILLINFNISNLS